MNQINAITTNIPGLVVFDLPTHPDDRGYFQEKFQKEKLVEAGLPSGFNVVQSNISYNKSRGVLRGLHAEPWDKFISVVSGKFFGAYLDLRAGESFGQTFTTEIDQNKAIYLPRGVANSFLTLEETYYIYFTNDHWSPSAEYVLVNPTDQDLDISWPIPISQCTISEKDLNHPPLKTIQPMELA